MATKSLGTNTCPLPRSTSERCPHPGGRQRKLPQPLAGRVEERVRNRRGRGRDDLFAGARRFLAGTLHDDRRDVGVLFEAQDRVTDRPVLGPARG